MKKGNIVLAAAVVMCSILMGCKGSRTEILPVSGTLEEALGEDTALPEVCDAMASLEIDDRYELMLDDSVAHVSVWSLIWTLISHDRSVSSNARGIMVVKDGKATAFPGIYHGHSPSARYDADSKLLRLACGDMEGTGVYVERLYLLRFNEDNSAHIVQSIDPYDVQQALRRQIGYSIDGQSIAFYDGERLFCSVTDTITGMGGFDEEPVWIGEQLCYDLSGNEIRVLCTPGLKYVTGLVLNYDVMPTIAATMTFNPDGSFTLGNVGIEE